MFRNAVLKHAVAQRFDDMITVQSPGHADRQTFSRELINHGQKPQAAAIVRAGFHKVVTPDMIRFFRSQPDTRSVVQPQTTARLLLNWHLQALASPDALYPVFADAPTCLLQQHGDPPVAEPPIFTGQRDNRFGQLIFIVPLCGLITLRSAGLRHQSARLPFTQSFFPSVVNGDPAPLGT